MRNDRAGNTRQDTLDDIGTLWSMYRDDHRARCALMAAAGEWEVRVVVDGMALLTETCDGPSAAFAIAQRWKHLMISQRWRQIVPGAPTCPSLDERYPA